MLGLAIRSEKRIIPVIVTAKIDQSASRRSASSAAPTGQRLRYSLKQLEVFTATARAGSTRAAAGQVARSQSAASAALADLEQVLGAELFDRVGRRLVLNENGAALLPLATALLEQAQDLAQRFIVGQASSLALAASFTIGEYLLPGLIATWKRQHPTSHVRLAIDNTAEVLAAVAAFDADIGFIEGSGSHPDLVVRQWRRDELILVAAPDHPFAATRGRTTRRVGPDRLATASWILRERGSGTREATDRWLGAHLDGWEIGLELGSNEAVKRAVRSGLGIGCLSRLAVAETLADGRLVEIRTGLAPITRTLGIVLHRGRHPGPAAQRFLGLCRAGG